PVAGLFGRQLSVGPAHGHRLDLDDGGGRDSRRRAIARARHHRRIRRPYSARDAALAGLHRGGDGALARAGAAGAHDRRAYGLQGVSAPSLSVGLRMSVSALFARLVDALADERHGHRTAAGLLVVYALLWWSYAVVAKSTQSIHFDMGEV